MNEKQYANDVMAMSRMALDTILAALKEPNPHHYDERLALLDTLEETILDLRERWENDEDEDD